MSEAMKLYKVLDENNRSMHGGSGKWTPGRWRSVRGPLVACRNGLHLCSADQIIDWLGPRVWEVETDGKVIYAGDKYVARRARIVREVETWNEQSARHFAADCAEYALQYADTTWRETLEVVIHVARAYADGEATDEELDAAWAAARAAAWGAAWGAARGAARDAARAAAWGAARAAALAAARDAAWDAARAAARAAARDAAWDAAWDALSKMLVERLGIA